jgi:hypothetical protein
VWTVRTVAAILANPRYTGRQVWNRQRIDHHEIVPGNKRTGSGKTRAWNPRSEWSVSARPAHPALVSEVDFRAAQNINAAATPHDDGARNYALTGLLASLFGGPPGSAGMGAPIPSSNFPGVFTRKSSWLSITKFVVLPLGR